ncbi:ABC transporter substrate-binding protein [Nonomuraea sp. NPDC050404]|uniref:ABC transporter substrate-binding protein n=1 Tax=Nonomuraea sp. NPDC050404 TaxID=3155783 RepID=UPI0033D9D97E
MSFKTVMRMRRGRLLAPLVMASALLMSACSWQAQSPAGAAPGRELTIATTYAIDDLDPATSGYWGVEFGYVELLMRASADGVPTPWVLSGLEAVDDRTWRLTLNEAVTFVNGRPFDAKALAATLEWSAEHQSGFARSANFASAKVTGPLEVTLRTTAPTPTMPNLLADESNVLVMDVEAYQEYKSSGKGAEALLEAGLYTGPYKVTSLGVQGAELAPVENYWQGEPALDRLGIRFVTEATSRVQAVQSGEVDLALYMPVSTARTLQGRKDAYFLKGEPTGLVFGLISRVTSPLMRDEAVRRAIYRATDYRAIAGDVLQGHAGYAKGVFPPRYPYTLETQQTDLKRAASELEAAGWAAGGDGIREKDGERLVIRVLCTPALADGITIAEAMQSQLREAGIEVKVVQVDDHGAARDGADWDVSLSSSLLSFGGSPDQALSELLASGGANNYAKIADSELDSLISELGKTSQVKRRTELLRQVQRLIWDRGYYAVAAQRLLTVVVGPQWRGYRVPVPNLWVDHKTAPTT